MSNVVQLQKKSDSPPSHIEKQWFGEHALPRVRSEFIDEEVIQSVDVETHWMQRHKVPVIIAATTLAWVLVLTLVVGIPALYEVIRSWW